MPSPGINPNPSMNFGRGDWIDAAAEIRRAKEELRKYEGIMTPYERQSISGSIQEKIASRYGFIYQGAAADLNGAKKQYKDTVSAREKARAQEITSWDSGKLGIEMNTFQMLVNREMEFNNGAPGFTRRADVSVRVKTLYQEAMASGDRYKMRAAVEVVHGINTDKTPKDQAVELRILGRECESVLETLRTTPEMLKAAEAEKSAVKELFSAKELVKEVAVVMGEDPDNLFAEGGFTKLLKTVQVDRYSGEVKIFEMDSPEVSGVNWQNAMKNDEDYNAKTS